MFLAVLFPYVLSQFFRAFMAVVAVDLSRDLHTDAAGLAGLQAAFLIAFAFVQLPAGFALDRIGPRRTLMFGLCAAALGSAVLSFSTQFEHGVVALALLGAGFSPVMITGFYLIARTYPERFATLSSLLFGLGSLGDPISGLPLALLVNAFGWRLTMLGMAAVTLASAACVMWIVRDPPRVRATEGSLSAITATWQVLRIRALWPIFPLGLVSYAVVAATRGLWMAPYLQYVHQFTPIEVSVSATSMGFAAAIGGLIYGPLNRVFGNAKSTVIAGVGVTIVGWAVLGLFGERDAVAAVALLLLVACFGASFAIILVHARSFLPTHLLGLGVAMMNMTFFGGAGLCQLVSGRYVKAAELAAIPPSEIFGRLFVYFAVLLAIALAIYLFAPAARSTPAVGHSE